MAQLPTPTPSGAFTAVSTVTGDTDWPSQSNLTDLDRVEVRFVRISGSTVAPSRADAIRGSKSTSWTNFTSGGRTYQYLDRTFSSGFSTSSPFSDRVINFTQSLASTYTVWLVAILRA